VTTGSSQGASQTASASSTAGRQSAATPAKASSHAAHTPSSHLPAGAPATGGGGTAGLRDGMLFGLGGAAILAGLASLAYRRRLTRTR